MLTCHACMKRCLQTLIGESTLVSASHGSALATNRNRRRNYTSGTVPHSSPPRQHKTVERKPKFTSHKPENGFQAGTVSTSYKRQKWLESRGVTPLHKRAERESDDLLMKKQLKYLKDPLKLAEQVRKILRDDDFESAVALVRAASKDTQCIVSWNHLIDWQLSRQKMNGAIKTYNEMKKRAQTPDAYTYTIIFRGCAEHPLPDQALAKVITIYNSMLADKSPIKPNTIHLNSVLKMCAKSQDMEALFSIAARLHAKGVQAPNNLTYTIILNAIRINTFVDLRGDLTPVQQRRNRQKASWDARLLWEDITKRWLQGDIMIDEELVCTMGRVLLLGNDNDIDDILSLIQQTMNIPRQAPRLTSSHGQERDPRRQDELGGGLSKSAGDLLASGSVTSNDQGQVEADPIQSMADLRSAGELSTTNDEGRIEADSIKSTEGIPSTNELASPSDEIGVTVADPFKAASPPKNLTKKGSIFFAKPGQNTLSLLMSALLDLRQKQPAAKYWNILTKEYQVEPDADNYHGYLRILRQARASTETVQLLLQMPQSYMGIKTFRITMSTCDRDKNNQHSFSNAGKVLDLMQTRLQVPDFQVLSTYLDIACSATAYSEKVSSNSQHAASKIEKGKQILRALYRIKSSYTNLRSLMAYGDPTKPEAAPFEKTALSEAVLSLTQRMVSAYDLVMNKALVDRTQYTELTKERSKLAAFITRFKHQKNGNGRPTSSRDIAPESSRYLRRATDPGLQRQRHFAKQEGGEGVNESMNNWGSTVAENANEEENARREEHSENIRGSFAERFAEQERKAAEAAWPVVNPESARRREKPRMTTSM